MILNILIDYTQIFRPNYYIGIIIKFIIEIGLYRLYRHIAWAI